MKLIKYWLQIQLLFLIVFSQLQAGQWKTFVPMTTPRAGAASVVMDGKIYVLGGKSINNKILNTVECFDPEQGAWIENALPPFSEERYNAAAIVFNNKLYLIGGRGDEEVLDEVEVYDPVQNEWRSVQNIHEQREGHAAVILNDHIFVIGGQENEHEVTKEIEWFDESEDEWIELKEKCPYPRVAQFAASYNNIFYMFGGYYYGLNNQSYKWPNGTMHQQWEALPSLSQARAYGATVVKNDSLFLIGGETADGKTNLVEIFDLKQESMSIGTPLPKAQSGMTGVCLNDTIFVMGGYDNTSSNPIADVIIFVETPTAMEDFTKPPVVRSQTLVKGYPNPFNGQITLEITFPRLASYRIDIYNLTGQHVKRLFDGIAIAERKKFIWRGINEEGQAVSSGIYWLVVRSPFSQTNFKIVYTR